MAMERTLAIIKPDAVKQRVIGRIVSCYEQSGLQIAAMKMARLTGAEAESFYAVHRERPFFLSLVSFMSSGPIVALLLEGEDAIRRHRVLMGATDPAKADNGTIRKLFGRSIEENVVHGSDSAATAAVEIPFFFSPTPRR